MEKKVIVDINELKDLKSKININGNDLITLLYRIIKCTEETKDSFNSLAGDEFRTQMIDYLNKRIKYIQDNYLAFIDDLDLIIDEYIETYDSISEMIGEKK